MKHPNVTVAHANGEGFNHKPVRLDVMRLAETRLLVQASSGGGKSYAIRKLLEATHGHLQHLIIDPEGEFSSLRSSFDYVYIAKGEKTEPDPKTAQVLARSLLELGVSAIIDIYELHPRDRRHWVRLFLEALIDSPKNLWHPALVVLDEAHEFAPEQSESEALDAVVALAAKGRKRDFAAVIATQRPAKLNKDVAAECQNKLIGLANLDIDRKRAGDELGFRTKEELLQLRGLDPGEFYAVGPAFRLGEERVREPVKITVDPVVTPHGRKAKTWRPRKLATSKQVGKALEALAKIPKQAEQELKDLESMRARIRELEREARELRKGVPKKDPEAEKRSFEAGRQAERKEFSKVANQIKNLKNKFTAKLQELGLLVEQIPDVDQVVGPVKNNIVVSPPARAEGKPAQARYIRAKLETSDDPRFGEGETRLSKPARLMLNLLVAKGGDTLSKAQLAGWTGYSITSSTFANALSELNVAGFIRRQGDSIALQEGVEVDAIDALGGDFNQDIDFSIDGWMNKLSAPARKMLALLKEAPDQVLGKEYLSSETGYSQTSSTFANGLSELCVKKLAIRKDGGIQINTELLR